MRNRFMNWWEGSVKGAGACLAGVVQGDMGRRRKRSHVLPTALKLRASVARVSIARAVVQEKAPAKRVKRLAK